MKAVLTIIAILMIGMFAGIGVMAQDSVTSDDVETELSSEEIDEALEEATEEEDSDKRNYRRIGFAEISRGFGSIDDGENGHLITGFWVTQKFAIIDPENDEIIESKERSNGLIKILGVGNYIIVKDTEASSETNLEFIVTRSRRHLSESEAENNFIGTLSLTISEEFEGLTRWTGTLEIESNTISGTWDVELSTDDKAVRKRFGQIGTSGSGSIDRRDDSSIDRPERTPNASDNARERAGDVLDIAGSEPVKRGFWERFFSQFRRN